MLPQANGAGLYNMFIAVGHLGNLRYLEQYNKKSPGETLSKLADHVQQEAACVASGVCCPVGDGFHRKRTHGTTRNDTNGPTPPPQDKSRIPT